MLSKGTYLGTLYDIGFDKPEGHLVAAEDKLHYAFYAKKWSGPVELRGLGKGRYTLTNSFTGEPLGTASADANRIQATFERFLVIEAAPAGAAA
jgi:alpha-galactosidase